MKKIILILIIILAIIIGGYFLFFHSATKNKTQLPNDFVSNDVDVVIRDMTNVPAEYYSGGSHYSQGACKQDQDCFADGCNLEVCTSDKNLMTTCEISGDMPDKVKYACGCIRDACGWYPVH